MRKLTFLFLIVFGMIFNSARSQSISDLLNGYYAYNRFSGNVLIAQNGKIVFQKSYGYADKDRNTKNDAGTLFNLASVTKTITATAILKLHDEGKLSLYDRVDKYIPGFINDKTDSLTIINLLNHTSGMIANINHREDFSKEELVIAGNEPITFEQLIAKFKETKLKNKPGTKFDYNNYGYVLLAYIIEKVSGMDYISYLNKTIFSKTGMTETFNQLNLPATAATGYAGIGTGNIYPVKDETHPSWYTGAAGIYSSTADLSKFLQSVFSHQLFSGKTLKFMMDSCVVTDRGNILWSLGWQKQEIDGQDFYSHGGSTGGFSTLIGYLPGENISIVILSNLVKDISKGETSSVNFSFVNEIAENIIKIMNGKYVTYLPVPAGKADKKQIGNYKLDDSHFMNISLQNDSLYLSTENNNNFTLFDYNLTREINDTSGNYKICKDFTTSLISGNFKGFEKYASEEMKRDFFNEKGIASLMNFWQYANTQCGKYLSSNICNKIPKTDYTDYSLAYHFEQSEVTMQLSFNNQGLISGFFILKLIPKCLIHTVNLVPTGKDEYFIDGYRYGGYNDFRVKYDKTEQSLRFNTDNENFAALKSK
jgi:CubicO group peptidase (beta-lactamase class C family)